MSLCGISRRRLIAGTAAAAALSQVSAESLSIASAGREAVVYQTTSLTAEGLVAALFSAARGAARVKRAWALAGCSIKRLPLNMVFG